jgi:ribosomal protein S12 methylthiotransferase accessory factor
MMTATGSASGLHTLLDERLGIVQRVERARLHPHLPGGLRLVLAHLAETTRFCPWPADRATAGTAWWDDDAAVAGALGEAVERYCGNLIPSGLRRTSYDELVQAGERAVEPASLALYSDEQYASPGFPFVRLSADLPVRWAEGRDLATGERILVPASLVWVTYFRAGPTTAEPFTNYVIHAGIAAGTTRADAERRAIEELFERDAIMLGWLSGERWTRIRLDSPLERMLRGPAGALEATVYLVPNEFGLPVTAALLRDRVTGVLAMGTAFRPDPRESVLKALAEAAQQHVVAYDLDDPAGSLRRAIDGLGEHPLKPWRADRAYRRSYRADWRDMRELHCHLQLYLDPAMHDPLEERLAGGDEIDLDDVPHRGVRERDAYVALLARHGYRAIGVDVTTSDIRRLGLHATRVIVPGFYSNGPAAFLFLGGGRLAERLRAQGAEAVLCTLPLPYA